MIDTELRKVQLVQLEIAKEVKRICDENNIKYFLDSGTLLGAVRHQGFIPWDDDLDIGMMRDEYEKFLEIAPKVLNEKYELLTWDKNKGYGLCFSKIQKRGTVYLEKMSKRVKTEHGIFIDIFPYDNYPDNLELQKKQGKRITWTKKLLVAKCKYAPWNENVSFNGIKYLLYIPIRIVSFFIKKEKLVKYYDLNAKAYNNTKTEKVFSQGIEPYGTFIFPSSCMKEVVELEFEDTSFKVMAGYDEYLKCAYGDYMTPPPAGKRENRHGIIKLDFGNEEES